MMTTVRYYRSDRRCDMANPNAYKGSTKSESSFVRGVKQAQKRREQRDKLDKLRAQEALANKNKNKKRKRK